MKKRIRTASPLQLSFRDRTLYLSFYVLSLPHYHHSTLLPTSPLIDRYTSLIRKFLCRRHWIQAQHLPGIVTFLKLGILHCPKIFLYSSLLGFAIRRFGEPLVAWLCGVSHSLPSLPAQIETGLRSIRSLLWGLCHSILSRTRSLSKLTFSNKSAHTNSPTSLQSILKIFSVAN